ncbi:MAG TPA: 1-(5-phosphoribosyl)-5-[(5-phosphoribosylamino)methylideneamino]imidazole-4-carboxamide isomerase [Armatimonadota bacterium]|nr:1-(5-phosphoribosyl)-5-[(5-phosphoribosylamino)methylideneamino]imidazole-4-carboxamide isomerase [Armatimonadota bacterium]
MEIIPAIDLRGGRCVRLLQGDYGRETVFSLNPPDMAMHWESLGARRLHVVDLDGAREGEPKNLPVVAEICASVKIPVQLGGGIRDVSIARQALDVGVQRVIVGTAVLEPEAAARFAGDLGEAVVAGIDARDGFVAVRGWLDTTQIRAIDLAKKLVDLGLRWLVFTDIATDGMLGGPNVPALREMVAAVDASVIASGGIASVDDLLAARRAGAAGAIVGTALYTGKLNLREALQALC